jgi:trigger factor
MKITSFLLALSVWASTSDAFYVTHPTPNHQHHQHATATALFMAGSILERLPESSVQVTITAPASATKASYEKACTELSKSITIPGFRKGAKIPPQVLEQAMSAKGGRNALRVQAINSLLAELIEPALKEDHGLEPIGQPTLVIPAEELAKTFQPGQELQLQVKCDVWPDIEWKAIEGQDKPYMNLEGSYKRKPFNQVKFDKALNDLMERYATLQPIDDTDHALELGDACVVNMVGFMALEDGSKGDPLPDAASGDRVEVIMGPGRYMPGLVEGLVGGKAGDTKLVSVTFPVVRSIDCCFFWFRVVFFCF